MTCPAELSKTLAIHGHVFTIRPMNPADMPLLEEMVHRSDPEDIRMRFFVPLKDVPSGFADRLSHLDYNHNMAFVAIELEQQAALAGIICILGDPTSDKAEYAVMVRSDLKGQGLGYQLMQEILDYARRRQLGHVTGKVLLENVAMLKMVRELGGKIAASADPCVIAVDFDLNAADPRPH